MSGTEECVSCYGCIATLYNVNKCIQYNSWSRKEKDQSRVFQQTCDECSFTSIYSGCGCDFYIHWGESRE